MQMKKLKQGVCTLASLFFTDTFCHHCYGKNLQVNLLGKSIGIIK